MGTQRYYFQKVRHNILRCKLCEATITRQGKEEIHECLDGCLGVFEQIGYTKPHWAIVSSDTSHMVFWVRDLNQEEGAAVKEVLNRLGVPDAEVIPIESVPLEKRV